MIIIISIHGKADNARLVEDMQRVAGSSWQLCPLPRACTMLPYALRSIH